MANTNCKKCGCQDKFLTPAPCPSPQGCPQPENCSEIFNAGCIEYTGTNITCDDEIIVATGDRVSDALIAIADLACNSAPLCNMQVTITSQDEFFPILESNIVGGTAPYTYSWSIVQGPFVGHTIYGATNQADLNLDCIGPNGLQNGEQTVKISSIRLDVVDAAGCKESAYYTFASPCYPIFTRQQGALPPYAGGEDVEFFPIAYGGIDFIDDVTQMPTCDELTTLICPDPETYGMEESEFETARDTFNYYNYSNLNAEYYGLPYNDPIDYTIYEPGELGDQLVFYKGGLKTVNISYACPASTYVGWTTPDLLLGGDSVADRLPTVVNITWLTAVPIAGSLPATGQPGDAIKDLNTNIKYLWDPTLSAWSQDLYTAYFTKVGNTKENQIATLRAATNAVILSMRPFTWAADYAPCHRLRKELI